MDAAVLSVKYSSEHRFVDVCMTNWLLLELPEFSNCSTYCAGYHGQHTHTHLHTYFLSLSLSLFLLSLSLSSLSSLSLSLSLFLCRLQVAAKQASIARHCGQECDQGCVETARPFQQASPGKLAKSEVVLVLRLPVARCSRPASCRLTLSSTAASRPTSQKMKRRWCCCSC